MILRKLRGLLSPLIFHYPGTIGIFLTITSLSPLLGHQLVLGSFWSLPYFAPTKRTKCTLVESFSRFGEESSWAKDIAKDPCNHVHPLEEWELEEMETQDGDVLITHIDDLLNPEVERAQLLL